VASALDSANVKTAIERVLSEVAIDGFRNKVVVITPNETTASAGDRIACTPAVALDGQEL
jgi:hypothetical protein